MERDNNEPILWGSIYISRKTLLALAGAISCFYTGYYFGAESKIEQTKSSHDIPIQHGTEQVICNKAADGSVTDCRMISD